MTTIEWAQNPDGSKGESWNPIRARSRATGKTGWFCVHVNAACNRCYAETWNGRLGNGTAYRAQDRDRVEIYLDDKTLTAPLRWKKPRRIFVCSMNDLFLDDHPDAWLDRIFAVMALCPRHTFIVLTKRPERMRAYLDQLWLDDTAAGDGRITAAVNHVLMESGKTWGDCGSTGTAITTHGDRKGRREPHMLRALADGGVERLIAWHGGERWHRVSERYADAVRHRLLAPADDFGWGLKEWLPFNVWLLVTVHDQPTADAWVPLLRATPAAVRGLSIEPMLGPIDLSPWLDFLDWVIVGGLSDGDVPLPPAHVRALRDQCTTAGVAFFLKQWGDYLVGEPTTDPADGNPTGLPLRFQDGETFDVNSDGEDILLSAAYDEPAGPRRIWRQYYGWRGHLVRKVGKARAGRTLDGRTWDEFPAPPSLPNQDRVERLAGGRPPAP